MRDASVLGQKLSAADRNEMPLLRAIHDYEREMLGYGFDAARRSMEIVRQVNAMPRP